MAQEAKMMPSAQPAPQNSGWGHTAMQIPVDNRFNNFGAENIPKPPISLNEIKKEDDDFERSISMTSEYNFSENNDKFTGGYARSNFGDLNKAPIEGRPSAPTIPQEERANSMAYSIPNTLKDQITATVKPVPMKSNYSAEIVEKCSMIIPVVMKEADRGEWNSEILFKIKSKSDTNSAGRTLIFELTMEEDPQFLYTCEFGEQQCYMITQEQGLTIEFHQFERVLFESFLKYCTDMRQAHNLPENYQYCTLEFNQLSKSAKFSIMKKEQFRLSSSIYFIFEDSSEVDKLSYLSNNIKDLKKEITTLQEQKNFMDKKLESANQHIQGLSQQISAQSKE